MLNCYFTFNNNGKPPVSPNEKVYARMTCAVKPDKIKAGDELDSSVVENYALLVDYVLYRLFGAETESATSQQKSAYHYKQFLDNVLPARFPHKIWLPLIK